MPAAAVITTRFLIADDDVFVCETVESYLAKIDANITCIKVEDGVSALRLITSSEVDAAFLDLDMPELDGISLLKALPEDLPVVVVSASDEFGARSYEFDVVDYLVKPLEFSRFKNAVERMLERISLQSEQAKTLVSPKPTQAQNSSLFVRDSQRIVRVDLSQLVFVQAEANYVKFFLKESTVMTLMTLKRAEEALPGEFIRIHRSYLVNLNFIIKIEGGSVYVPGHQLPLGQSYRESAFEKLGVM